MFNQYTVLLLGKYYYLSENHRLLILIKEMMFNISQVKQCTEKLELFNWNKLGPSVDCIGDCYLLLSYFIFVCMFWIRAYWHNGLFKSV